MSDYQSFVTRKLSRERGPAPGGRMKFILILAILLLGVMLMACGGSSEETTTPAPAVKGEA